MESTTKQLRDYQVRLVTDVCRATEDVLVEQPTGSGKTVQIVTLVAMHLGQRFSHAVISAPQEQIEQRSEEHTSELQSLAYLVCRLLLEKKKKNHSALYAHYRVWNFEDKT